MTKKDWTKLNTLSWSIHELDKAIEQLALRMKAVSAKDKRSLTSWRTFLSRVLSMDSAMDSTMDSTMDSNISVNHAQSRSLTKQPLTEQPQFDDINLNRWLETNA
ncbi:MAG: hypothetical protein AAF639_39775, partial [Chloroflexota bacterium]